MVRVSSIPWVSLALVVVAGIFAYHRVQADRVTQELQDHFAAVSNLPPGGVLLIMSPADCLLTREAASQVVAKLHQSGFAARGLVIKDGVDPGGLRSMLDEGNASFPHYPVSLRMAARLAGTFGLRQTPIMLTVDGRTGVVEVIPATGLPATDTDANFNLTGP